MLFYQTAGTYLEPDIQKYNRLLGDYYNIKSKGISLDISRGKPCKGQLDLSMGMLKINDYMSDGVDCRNYGNLQGAPEAIKFFAELFGNKTNEVIVAGNSSLNMMYFLFDVAWRKGYPGYKPFSKSRKLKFLCPSPGYDRHFRITEDFGFELIPIQMTENGPDMDEVERLVSKDKSIKGIWCIPVYSNPDGYVYSAETVMRFAKFKPLAKDFKIFWDNAYMIHGFTDEEVGIPNLLNESKKFGNEDHVFMFCSTSKVTFAGAGISAIAASENNIKFMLDALFPSMICFDKMSQLRHVKFFDSSIANLKEHMKKHAQFTGPRFKLALDILDAEFEDGNEFVHWTKPNGGYFISLYVHPGCAKRVVELCKEAGLKLTPAGVTYPYGNDPDDSNIRLAPTCTTMEELEMAVKLLCLCIKIAVYEKKIV